MKMMQKPLHKEHYITHHLLFQNHHKPQGTACLILYNLMFIMYIIFIYFLGKTFKLHNKDI